MCLANLLHAVVKSGYYAVNLAATGVVNATAVCPQNFVCEGGIPTAAGLPQDASSEAVYPCPDGMWTQEPGAMDKRQCSEFEPAYSHPPAFAAGVLRMNCPGRFTATPWAVQQLHCVKHEFPNAS